VIVAVVSQRRLLLARAGRFGGRMFSVIAGYVEPGETLEDCVRREVHEEVGLQVGHIRYFGSQPWPFSGSLMVAFTARHTGGRIAVDNQEIVEAGWFTADELPEIPGKMSIARQLIDWYVQHYGSASPDMAAPIRGSS
jgi:NAD+ diphosphatase